MPAYTTDSGDNGGRRQLVAAAVLLIVAVSIALLPSPMQQQIASAVRGTVLRPFVLGQRGLSVTRARAVDSETLRRKVDSLVAVTATHRALAEENRRLQSLLDMRTALGSAWIPATVIRPGTAGSESMFLLDVGSEVGVEPYAPVIGGQGLVGVVREVHGRSSMGMDWTHPDFRVSAMDPDGITYGIVETRRGDFREADRLEFNGTAFHARLEDGTVIVTSGLGGVWPRGVAIGKVEGLAEADAGWRKSYWLRPMVEVGGVTHVLVGVGPEARRDLTGYWSEEQLLTDGEMAVRSLNREDSVRALGDSVAVLRALLAASMPVRDSLLHALRAGWTVPPAGQPDTAAPPGPAQPQRAEGPETAPAAPAPEPRTVPAVPEAEPAVPQARPAIPVPVPGDPVGPSEPEPAPTPDPAPGGDPDGPRRLFPAPGDTVPLRPGGGPTGAVPRTDTLEGAGTGVASSTGLQPTRRAATASSERGREGGAPLR